jgi:hypothetical protein
VRGRRLLIVLAALGASLVVAAPAIAAPQPTVLTIEAAEVARTGEAHEITVTLTDARGAPVAGESVTVTEQLRFFDYRGRSVVGAARTNHLGTVRVTHVPSAAGTVRLGAEYAGSEELGASTDARTVTVDVGVGVASPVLPGPPEPLLPRGVTAVWFVPLLLGVWLAIAAAVYNAMRIPMEREDREVHEVAHEA